MTADRIKEIQAETGYPNSTSVQQALMKVWNECQQEQEQVKNCSIPDVRKSDGIEREALFALLKWMQNEPIFNIDSIDEILDDYEYYKANCR